MPNGLNCWFRTPSGSVHNRAEQLQNDGSAMDSDMGIRKDVVVPFLHSVEDGSRNGLRRGLGYVEASRHIPCPPGQPRRLRRGSDGDFYGLTPFGGDAAVRFVNGRP